jgi:hypothetical protein
MLFNTYFDKILNAKSFEDQVFLIKEAKKMSGKV